MKEQWREIPGYEGYYQASDKGRIKRTARACGATPGHIRIARQDPRTKYFLITLHRKGVSKTLLVHRIVAAAFLGPCPSGLEVNHKNGDKIDNCPENLEYVTRSANTRHAFRVLGRIPVHGEAHANAKLTANQVLEIRASYATGHYTQAHLASQYGVSACLISLIVNRKHWQYLKEPDVQ